MTKIKNEPVRVIVNIFLESSGLCLFEIKVKLLKLWNIYLAVI